ncbi:Cap protein [egret CRESS-DNA virus]|nr:Cap protein [egret CRESS-DNA virus]UBQ66225.1 Cap protein [egret CRESS-DNA virus]
MAYSTKRRARRSYTRKGYSKRRSSYTGRRRTYRRTKKTSRRMSRKGLLNATSTKKQDTMLAWSNTNSAGGQQTIAARQVTVKGDTGYWGIFNATARDLEAAAGKRDRASRSATTCFAVGIREQLRIQTGSALPWLWRRICFTYKGDALTDVDTDTPTSAFYGYVDTTNGLQRAWVNSYINNEPGRLARQQGLIFQGTASVDWNNPITAKVDTTRVSLKYDQTRALHTGNSSGYFKVHKVWHGMYKNIVYGDEERGALENSVYVSTESKAGMGDYYIVDIFQPGVGGATGDLLAVDSSSTYYWHEK